MRRYDIVETAVYSTSTTTRRVETALRRRAATRAVRDWQAASNRNKLMIVTATPRTPLPIVTYTVEPTG